MIDAVDSTGRNREDEEGDQPEAETRLGDGGEPSFKANGGRRSGGEDRKQRGQQAGAEDRLQSRVGVNPRSRAWFKIDVNRTDPALVLKTYHALPDGQRSIDHLNAKLVEMGCQAVPRSSLYRWIRRERRSAAQVMTRSYTKRMAESARAAQLEGVPPEIVEALGLRLFGHAKGKGLDLAEDAISRVMTAIGDQAQEIAKQIMECGTNEAAAAAVDTAMKALQICADAHHRVMQARTLTSFASRNFAEGDRYAAEAKKFDAEAEIARATSRADNAKTIAPRDMGDVIEYNDDDEALTQMRALEAAAR